MNSYQVKVKTVAIIPARGGSKGIKDKNIRELNGIPLICHSLSACHRTEEIDLVVVTTDSPLIANITARYFPDTVIVNRPAELAGDLVTSELAILHCLTMLNSNYPTIENVLFVQATSPLTQPADLSNLYAMLSRYDSAAFYVDDYGFFFETSDLLSARLPRQERKPLRREAGNAWAFKKVGFMSYQTRLFGNYGLCRIDNIKSLEIDEETDFEIISCVMCGERFQRTMT
jgi:CMP-N-acetylneuraminic acid synthetase